MAKVTTIPLADIIRDRALQPRVGTNRLVVSRYAQAMREGAQFPPVRVYRIKGDGRLVLSDGWHRYDARKHVGATDIEAEVVDGTMRDALRHAIEFNAQHGLTFTREDQQRAIELYLKDDGLRQLPDREIARRLACSPTTIGTHRARLYPPKPILTPATTVQLGQGVAPPTIAPIAQTSQAGTAKSVQVGQETKSPAQSYEPDDEAEEEDKAYSARFDATVAEALEAVRTLITERLGEPSPYGVARIMGEMLGTLLSESEDDAVSVSWNFNEGLLGPTGDWHLVKREEGE
jgi:hypothetical protein